MYEYPMPRDQVRAEMDYRIDRIRRDFTSRRARRARARLSDEIPAARR